ncbi:MAG: hypothetical protein RDU13_11315 [Elusimicrobiales bacterium]|nr:hypothetical protein [Elusimicrobiales bacterium]
MEKADGRYTMSMTIKNLFRNILAASFAFGAASAVPAFAGGPALETVSLQNLEGLTEGVELPQALLDADRAPVQPSKILDLSVKIPFKALTALIVDLKDAQISALDPSLPVLQKAGGNVAFRNVLINYNGIEAEPNILLKPVFEGPNRISIKVEKVTMDVSFGPKAMGMTELDKNAVMEMIMTKVSEGVTGAMDAAFAKNKVALRAADVLRFSYDRLAWKLTASVDPKFVAPLLPGLIDNINLSAFSFDEEGFALGAHSGVGAAQLPGFNLALSDGLVDNFVGRHANGDFQLHPQGYDGGVRFRADSRLEVGGKIYARDVFLKPNVYFKAIMLPRQVGPNTINVTIERVDVDKAYGIGLPGFINNWLQGKIISSVIETVTTNPELRKVVKASKINDNTVQIKLENTAFLPSFAKGVVTRDLRIGAGMMYLAFEL